MINVVKFIEENIELIDLDLPTFFIYSYSKLNHLEIEDVLKLLEKADIQTETARLDALHYILTMILEDWKPVRERDCYLMNFVAERLNHTLGFSQEYVVEYIKNNISEWSDHVRLVVGQSGYESIYPVKRY